MGLTYPVNHQTLSESVQELIEGSYEIYTYLKAKPYANTLVCGGQSPAYYCLAMRHFPTYDAEKVDLVVLPHSKGGVKSCDPVAENRAYAARLVERGIQVRSSVTIIDGVHTGVGILALEAALKWCYAGLQVEKIAINAVPGVAAIPVDREYIFASEPKFADSFPRLVVPFHPSDFHDGQKFHPEFNLKSNPLAQMIIDIARTYPERPVQESPWFILNHIVTPEILIARAIRAVADAEEQARLAGIRAAEQEEQRLKDIGGTFIPVDLHDHDGYKIQCPECLFVSGTLLLLTHQYNCPNRYKTTQESPGISQETPAFHMRPRHFTCAPAFYMRPGICGSMRFV